jgi:hypothetical protein
MSQTRKQPPFRLLKFQPKVERPLTLSPALHTLLATASALEQIDPSRIADVQCCASAWLLLLVTDPAKREEWCAWLRGIGG